MRIGTKIGIAILATATALVASTRQAQGVLPARGGEQGGIADQHPPALPTLTLESIDQREDGLWEASAAMDGVPGVIVAPTFPSLFASIAGTGAGADMTCAARAPKSCALVPGTRGVCYWWVIAQADGSWTCGVRCRYPGDHCPPHVTGADIPQEAWPGP